MSVCMVHIYTAAQNARNTDRSRSATVRIKMLKLVNSSQPTSPIVDWLPALVAVKWSRKLDSCQLTSIALVEIRVQLKFNYLAVFFRCKCNHLPCLGGEKRIVEYICSILVMRENTNNWWNIIII